MILAVTSDTWIVTGLGFGIVLALLFCLVFIMQFFGWTMQKMTAPRAPKAEKPQPAAAVAEPAPAPAVEVPQPKVQPSEKDEIAAVAYALFLAHDTKHDIVTATIPAQARETAWNTKSYGLNNVGF